MADRLLISKHITIRRLGSRAALRPFNQAELTTKTPVSDWQNPVNTSNYTSRALYAFNSRHLLPRDVRSVSVRERDREKENERNRTGEQDHSDMCIPRTISKCDCWTLTFSISVSTALPLHARQGPTTSQHDPPQPPWVAHSHTTHTTASDTELNGPWHVTWTTENREGPVCVWRLDVKMSTV